MLILAKTLSKPTMKFYVVFGVLAALALHALADESKDNAPTTVAVAADRTSVATKPNASTDGSSTLILH